MIEKIPFKEEVEELRNHIARFLRYHEIKFNFKSTIFKNTFQLFDLETYDFIGSLCFEKYKYNLKDVADSWIKIKELLNLECINESEFIFKTAEIIRYNVLLFMHVHVFWNKGNLDDFYNEPFKFSFFFDAQETELLWTTPNETNDDDDDDDELIDEDSEEYKKFRREKKALHRAKQGALKNTNSFSDYRFTPLVDEANIKSIFKALLGKYIHEWTAWEDFKSLFFPVGTSSKIRWMTTSQHCAYFLYMLREENIIRQGTEIWSIGQNRFLTSKRKPIKDLYKAYDNSASNRLREPFDDIASIIRHSKHTK